MTVLGRADLNSALRQLRGQPVRHVDLESSDSEDEDVATDRVHKVVATSERYIGGNTSLISGHQTHISRVGAYAEDGDASAALLQLPILGSQCYNDLLKAVMRDHLGNKALRSMPSLETVMGLLSCQQPHLRAAAVRETATKLWGSLDLFAGMYGDRMDGMGGTRWEVTASSISGGVQSCVELMWRERYELRAVETKSLMAYMYATAAAPIKAMLLVAERALACPLQVEHDLLTMFSYQQLVALSTGQARCMLQEECRDRLNGSALWCAPESAFLMVQPALCEEAKGAPVTLGLKVGDPMDIVA